MRDGLYEISDLMKGYDPKDPASFIQTWDYQQYIAFVADGGPAPTNPDVAADQAVRDAKIGMALRDYLRAQTPSGSPAPRLVAIMGGHSLNRGEPAYKLTAEIARDLTNAGFIVATGGGPGAMEAGHVGAYFAKAPIGVHQAAIAKLATVPVLPPDLGNILDPKTGAIVPNQQPAYQHAADWLNAAVDAKALLPAGTASGESLAVPTWLYGTEPSNPFASVYAKYFQNSSREETLVAEGRTGTLYAKGSGGTLREIFQGVEYNCYIQSADDFQPMIFVDPDHFWQTTASYDGAGKIVVRGINMADTISPIFKASLPAAIWSKCNDKVQFTSDLAEIRRVLSAQAPAATTRLSLMLQGEPVSLLSARFRARSA